MWNSQPFSNYAFQAVRQNKNNGAIFRCLHQPCSKWWPTEDRQLVDFNRPPFRPWCHRHFFCVNANGKFQIIYHKIGVDKKTIKVSPLYHLFKIGFLRIINKIIMGFFGDGIIMIFESIQNISRCSSTQYVHQHLHECWCTHKSKHNHHVP